MSAATDDVVAAAAAAAGDGDGDAEDDDDDVEVGAFGGVVAAYCNGAVGAPVAAAVAVPSRK